jgi:hypothetical protein
MDREVIAPEEIGEIVARAGYAPTVGDTIYVVRQVGRTSNLQIIEDTYDQLTCGDVEAYGYLPDDKKRSFP